MRHDHAFVLSCGPYFVHDVLTGKPVKSVSLQTPSPKLPRQWKTLRQGWHASVKCGVEANNLRNSRQFGLHHPDDFEFGGDMQRSKGQQSAKRFQELGRNLLGLLAISSPVHKAMTDRGDAYIFPPVELGQNLASGRTVIWKRGAMVQDGISRRLSDPQASFRTSDSFRRAACQQASRISVELVYSEFERGGTAIDGQNGVARFHTKTKTREAAPSGL